jgi:NAD+ kinase
VYLVIVKVILVTKRSTWDQYNLNPVAFGKLGRDSLRRAKHSHFSQERSTDTVLEAFQKFGIKPWIITGPETAFDASDAALVVTLGGDGTLLAASHHIGKKTPLLGINSDPLFSLGHFCAAVSGNFEKWLTRIFGKGVSMTEVTRMEILVGGKVVSKRVLNEALFSHTCPAAMTRFTLGVRHKTWVETERYSCSGVWIGTGAGSTGAIASAGGKVQPPTSKKLQAVIREHCGAKPGQSPVLLQQEFTLVSKSPDATLYLDGPFLRVPIGHDQRVVFRLSKDYLSLVL